MKSAGRVLDSEDPSDVYVTVNAYGDEKNVSPSNSNKMYDSMFNKTGPSQSSQMGTKAKQVATMKHAVNSFIGNMINNESARIEAKTDIWICSHTRA